MYYVVKRNTIVVSRVFMSLKSFEWDLLYKYFIDRTRDNELQETVKMA